jgi:hypothetical protein
VRNIVSFIGWLLKKWFVSNNSWVRKYERAVVRDSVPLFVLTLLLYGVVWGLSFVPLVVLDVEDTTAYITWAVLAAVMFGNYFRILLAAQYQQFKKERQQLFDKIKHL